MSIGFHNFNYYFTKSDMKKYSLLILILTVLFTSCKDEQEVTSKLTPLDYYPLAIGNYINYDLDSTVWKNFGTLKTIVSYKAQDRVIELSTDNLGRPSYRIHRYIRKTSSEPWVFSHAYFVTHTKGTIELIENNQRFIKLAYPIRNGATWKGNAYFNTTSIDPDYRFMDNWNYTYDSVNMPLTLHSFSSDSTLKVLEADEFSGQDPNIPGTLFGEKTYSVEKYAKGVGLIYREYIHWVYQGQEGRSGYYEGAGIKLTITGHN